MQNGRLRRKSRLAKLLALGLAALSLVFFLQVTAHGHDNGQQDAACRICQFVHAGAALTVTSAAVTVPFVAVGEVAAAVIAAKSEPELSQAPSRAPPSFLS